jgi:gas vesicle protein
MRVTKCAGQMFVLLSTAPEKHRANATECDPAGIYRMDGYLTRGFVPGTAPRYWTGKKAGFDPAKRSVEPASKDRVRRSGESKDQEKTMADNDSSVGGFGWFLAGLGIGALVGVLYAPKSGKETRDDLMQSAMEARDKANQLYNQGREQANQYVQQGRDALGQYVDKGKEYYDKGRTQWSQYVDKGKDLVQNQTDAVSAAVDAGKQAYMSKTSETPQA